MGRGKWRRVTLAVLGVLLLIPTAALAQSAIAGTVTDATGAVLPGVSVEARSPALIEQMRTVVSDDQGQYRIIDLRPGTYTVTFSLAGFSTVVREGIELPPNFTAPVSVQLRVGSLEETVTVSGASPVVDVQTTARREVVSQELIQTLPSGRTRESFMATIPAVRTSQTDVGGSTQMDNGLTAAYGGRNGDQDVKIDGLSVGSMIGDGSISIYIDVAPVQEYVVQTNASASDTQTGGVQINMVPKTGSNRFEHMLLYVGSSDKLKSNNITPEFLAQGIKPQRILRAFDANGSSAGPIRQNKIWYFASTRVWSFDTDVFNLFYNGRIKPAGTPVEDRNLIRTAHARLTFQLTPKNKLTVMHEHGWKSRDHQGVEQGNAYPESINRQNSPNTQLAQAKWTSTMTNKLLLETGWSFNHFDQSSIWPKGLDMPTVDDPYLNVRKIDLSGENRPYGSPIRIQSGPSAKHWVTGNLSYVTGTHALKGGIQFQRGFARRIETRPPNAELAVSLMQQYSNGGQPNSVVLYNLPRDSQVDMRADLGLYVQDSWTRGRLTLNPGLRYDYFHGVIPPQASAPGRFVPARSFAEVPDVPLWHDVTGRIGAAFDIFGNGKTAIKGSVGTYLWKSYTELARLYNPMDSDTDTRNWNDLNSDDKAQVEEFGPTTNNLFGSPKFNRRLDPNYQRERNTLYNISFDHELFPGLGASIAFNRRTGSDLGWTDNLAITMDDYTLLTVPDPRGNGETLPVYNISAAKRGVLDRVDFTSDINTRYYDGFDVLVHGRLPGGGQFFGGTSTGHIIEKSCQVDDPNISTVVELGRRPNSGLRFCDESQYDMPFQTFVKLSGSYPLPKGFRASVVYQRIPGLERVVLYPVTRTQLPQLQLSSVNVRLNEPGSEYLDAMNQVDLGLSGTIRLGRTQLKPQVDLFNLLNSSDVLTVNDTYGPSLGQPRKILFPRFVRFGLRFEF